MESERKTILFHSNYSKAFTGFGRNAKSLLKYLQSTDKYNIIEYCSGKIENASELSKMPWTAEGTLPADKRRLGQYENNPSAMRAINYGSGRIDEVIKKYKPDIYFGVEDIWAMNGYWNRVWWNNITPIVHTTLDSLPLHPFSFDCAEKTDNFYVWASFAEKAMKENGFLNVKAISGTFDDKNFYPLNKGQKSILRKNNKIPLDAFIIGFVFRNQLRKSVPNLLDGFKLFIEGNPNSNPYLLLHTNWEERGWDISQLISDKFAPPRRDNESKEEYQKRSNQKLKEIKKRILTTYYCSKCKNYHIIPYIGKNINCPFCKMEKTFNCCNVNDGVSELQLCEIYNLMDIYCHPFTSGGLEIPAACESKYCGIPVLATNYSCGIDIVGDNSGAWPLDYSIYYEQTSNFIKASTLPSSISKQLKKFYNMPQSKKDEMGKAARTYALSKSSINVIGPIWEKILDSIPKTNWDFNFDVKVNTDYPFQKDIESDSDFIKDLYKNILGRTVEENDDGFKSWMKKLGN
jgi:glycosyltransferase involved in cell wall biosynthesis